MSGLPYDDAAEQLRLDAAALAIRLELWAGRDESRGDYRATEAGHAALETLDRITRDLYAVRSRLVGELRASQDAAMARARETLGE